MSTSSDTPEAAEVGQASISPEASKINAVLRRREAQQLEGAQVDLASYFRFTACVPLAASAKGPRRVVVHKLSCTQLLPLSLLHVRQRMHSDGAIANFALRQK